MRHLREPEGTAKLRPFRDERHDASVVGPQELPQHEKGEELGLRQSRRENRLPYSGSAARPAASASRATLTADFDILRIPHPRPSQKPEQPPRATKNFNRAFEDQNSAIRQFYASRKSHNCVRLFETC